MRARDLIELDGATAREKTGFAVNRRRAIAPFPPGSSMPRMDMADGAQEIASKSRHRPAPQEIAPAIVRRPRWKSADPVSQGNR
jgi:hypothetical protein